MWHDDNLDANTVGRKAFWHLPSLIPSLFLELFQLIWVPALSEVLTVFDNVLSLKEVFG
jgi:hypothetical protein